MLRASWGKYNEQPSSSYVQYNALQQNLPIFWKGVEIAVKHVGDELSLFCVVARMVNKRRPVGDSAVAVVNISNLGKELRGCLVPRLFLDFLPAFG